MVVPQGSFLGPLCSKITMAAPRKSVQCLLVQYCCYCMKFSYVRLSYRQKQPSKISVACCFYLEIKSVSYKQYLNFTCGMSKCMTNKKPYQLPVALSHSQDMQTDVFEGCVAGKSANCNQSDYTLKAEIFKPCCVMNF